MLGIAGKILNGITVLEKPRLHAIPSVVGILMIITSRDNLVPLQPVKLPLQCVYPI